MTRTTSDLLGRDEVRQPGKNNKETCGWFCNTNQKNSTGLATLGLLVKIAKG